MPQAGLSGYPNGGEPAMVRWLTSTVKATVAVGALASLLVGAGAGVRWGDLVDLLTSLF